MPWACCRKASPRNSPDVLCLDAEPSTESKTGFAGGLCARLPGASIMRGSKFIDLNCDLGEGAGRDAELMPLITSANIACGGHTGDAASMQRSIADALARHAGMRAPD